jgi:hypothetical protein
MYNSDSNMTSDEEDEHFSSYSSQSSQPETPDHTFPANPHMEQWLDPNDEIQRAMAASLAEYESQPIQASTCECMPASLMDPLPDGTYNQSHDGLYMPSSTARQVFGSTAASSHTLIVYQVTPLITIPSESQDEEPIDLPMDDVSPVWVVLRGMSPDSATYLNDDAIRQLTGQAEIRSPVKCRLTPVTAPIPMGSKVTIRPLDRRFIELKDQAEFIAGSIGRLHKILWPGQIIRVYSAELDEVIRLMVQDVAAETVPEPPPDMLVQVTDCDLEIDFDIPTEWFKKPDANPTEWFKKKPEPPEPPATSKPPVQAIEATNAPEMARLTPAELRAQRLAYFNKQSANGAS